MAASPAAPAAVTTARRVVPCPLIADCVMVVPPDQGTFLSHTDGPAPAFSHLRASSGPVGEFAGPGSGNRFADRAAGP
ncbi:hypothetical protein GCM10009680_64140 [Streptomyces yatensis]|uniref:Uncharacterized protein n=1 Tax=Streptomyces yatensis TaxID=155177 RepID=A0ABN2IY49_9ACTN